MTMCDAPCWRCKGPQGGYLPVSIDFSYDTTSILIPAMGTKVKVHLYAQHLCPDCVDILESSDIKKLEYIVDELDDLAARMKEES